MLDFHLPTFGDKEWVEEVLRSSKHKGCIYSFGQLSLWADKYNTKICRVGDALCGIAGFDDLFYIYPAGIYDIKNIMNIMQEDAQKRGIPLRICAAEDWQWEELDSALPGLFTAQESRNDFDYIYSAKDLAELPGRKYHRKRKMRDSETLVERIG